MTEETTNAPSTVLPVIEENVPMPISLARRQGTSSKYAELRKLKVGQSVYYTKEYFQTEQDRRRLKAACAVYANRSGKHFVWEYRTADDGMRIWRDR